MTFSVSLLTVVLALGSVVRESQEYCPNKNLFACESCPDNVTCTSCRITYGLDPEDGSAGCKSCHESCCLCSVVKRCLLCKNDRQGPSLTDSYGSCAACSDNCQECNVNGAGRCDTDSCDEGYTLDEDSRCIRCKVPNCRSCSFDVNSCIRCADGYDLDSCGNCHPKYSPVKITPYTCEKKRYQKNKQAEVDSSTDCTNLLNCETCTTDGQLCLSCRKTYGIDTLQPNNGCQPCGAYCTLCSDEEEGIYKCTQCSEASYGPAQNGTCAPCAPNCKSCIINGGGNCDVNQCESNYYYSASIKKCVVGSSIS